MNLARTQQTLILAFIAVAAVFVGATVYTQIRAASIDADAVSIASDEAPSIQRLAASRVQVQQLMVDLQDLIDHPGPEAFAAVEAEKRSVDEELSAYMALPQDPDEREVFAQVERALGVLNSSVDRLVSLVRTGRTDDARAAFNAEIRPSVDAARLAIMNTVELNANEARGLALRIERNRRGERWVAFGLDALGLALTFAALGASLRVVRRYADLQQQHNILLERRADELETFAGRVAHDILSPLNPVSVFIGMAEPALRDEPQLSRAVDRARSGLMRAKRIVNDLLEFARAAAAPATTARADLDEVLADLSKELQPEAELADAQLSVVPIHAVVRASPGVVTSIVQNLARNALKYLGSAAVRKVEVRAQMAGRMVRVEVEDTGPGLPPGMEQAVFEPYVRASGVTQQGIGLGLATVKRLVTAHGGRAGVHSVFGKGCTFWFELPAAERPAASAPVVSAH